MDQGAGTRSQVAGRRSHATMQPELSTTSDIPAGTEPQPQPQAGPKRPLHSKPPHSLLQQLVNGALGPLSRITDAVNLTLEEVSDWIADAQNRNTITNLVTL